MCLFVNSVRMVLLQLVVRWVALKWVGLVFLHCGDSRL
jgi:hypothetical protein